MAGHQDTHIDYVEFPAPDARRLGGSKRFFAEAFGWAYTDWGDDYADTQGGGIGSGFNADADHRPAAPLVVLFATDLEATRSRVTSAGGTITRDIFSFPGGRRFHFREPSGNELAVWSEK